MKIGIRTFVTADTMPADRVAVKCESLGFESMWVCDHPILPVHHRLAPTRVDARVGISGHQMPEYYRAVPDPFVLLTQAGAVTSRIKLGTGICLVPEREPIGLAKTVATLDMCTGGRMLFGIGAGGIPLESEVMGVEYRRRWPMTREYIRAMKELWTAHESSFDGEFVKFLPVYCYPKPVQKPHPPIIIGAGGIGASSLRALKDTAALGDGWGPVSIGPEELGRDLATLKDLCQQAGRKFERIEITIFSPAEQPDPRRTIAQYEEAGAHRLVFMVIPPHLKDEHLIEDLAHRYLQ
ncbi:MAG: TIGR03619 family F420-dependent LLM class oxidoreductase [Candidatus Binataceae bacterium]